MKRIIHFTKYRFVLLTLSTVLIVGGIVSTLLRGGFNLGIDFQAGVNLSVQIAPQALEISYTGTAKATMNATGSGIYVKIEEGITPTEYAIPYEDNPTLNDVVRKLSDINGIKAVALADGGAASYRIIGIDDKNLMSGPVTLNMVLAGDEQLSAPIEQVRKALSPLESIQLQSSGRKTDQVFNIRVQDPGTVADFEQTMRQKVIELLQNAFGKEQVLFKQSAYIGPRFSKDLTGQVFYLVAIALLLIFIYCWFRFRWTYALATILATVHDALFMIAFIGVFQVEISTATIAAILTIIGYSINDTVVVFDRIRENGKIMRDTDLRLIIDTSITQTLGRTMITGVTTMMAILAFLIFGSGDIRNFSLNMVVGLVVGTYSSIFIASPLFLAFQNFSEKRRKNRDAKKFGKIPGIVTHKEQVAEDTEEEKKAPVIASTGAPAISAAGSGAETTGQDLKQAVGTSGPAVNSAQHKKKKKKKR